MNTLDINNLDLESLKTLLKEVKKYKDLKSKLGKRGVELFNLAKDNKSKYLVEYFGEVDIDFLYKLSSRVYKESFGEDIKQNDIIFKRNDNIKGGFKVYKDDLLVDLSFSKIEKQIR